MLATHQYLETHKAEQLRKAHRRDLFDFRYSYDPCGM